MDQNFPKPICCNSLRSATWILPAIADRTIIILRNRKESLTGLRAMPYYRVTQVACWALIAGFAISGNLYVPSSLPAGVSVYSGGRSYIPEQPNPGDEKPPASPVNSVPEDSSDTTGSDLIPPLARSLAMIHLEIGAYHPALPSVFYSLHANNELLRPPCI